MNNSQKPKPVLTETKTNNNDEQLKEQKKQLMEIANELCAKLDDTKKLYLKFINLKQEVAEKKMEEEFHLLADGMVPYQHQQQVDTMMQNLQKDKNELVNRLKFTVGQEKRYVDDLLTKANETIKQQVSFLYSDNK